MESDNNPLNNEEALSSFKKEHNVALRGMFQYETNDAIEESFGSEVISWLLSLGINPLSVIDMFKEYAAKANRNWPDVEAPVLRLIQHEQLLFDIENATVTQYHDLVNTFIRSKVTEIFPHYQNGIISHDELQDVTSHLFELVSMQVDPSKISEVVDTTIEELQAKNQ